MTNQQITPRLYCIPDIHGCLDLLLKLLETLFTGHALDLTKDKIVFLGDMIDRGPDSKGVLDKIRELTLLHPDNVIALAGNHEWLCINAHLKNDYDSRYFWDINGGVQTMESFNGLTNMPDDYVRWMANLPLYHEEPGYFLSHAPVPRENRRLAMNQGMPFTKDELMWTYDRDEFGIARVHDNGIVGICGHIHALSKGLMVPRFYTHYIFADAGCGCSPKAPLVAVELDSRQTIYAWPEI